jgi:putative heme-binding domain-containing protein
MNRFGRHVLLALMAGSAIAGTAWGQVDQDHAQYIAADIAYGSRIYAAQCTQCHGPTGDLVGGVDLRNGRFKTVATDAQISTLLTSGNPASGMPRFKFDNAELVAVVAYLRNMKTFDVASVAVGVAERGQSVFAGKGNCATCHRVDGRSSGGLAPDLGSIGTLRTASGLQTSILTPSKSMVPINRPVRAVKKTGEVIVGRRLNEDTFTVQLVDERGQLRSLQKSDLREYTIRTESLMPAYQGKLTPDEVADLVAYLLTLKAQS